MKKLILFDLDGTLLDTLEDLAAAVDYALEARGLPGHTLDEYRSMVGHGVRNLVAQALPSGSDDALLDAVFADFMSFYQAHIYVHTHPYPGIPELLEDLQAAGVKLAVASNKFQDGTEYLIGQIFPGIEFVAILGNRPGWPLKPSPEIVRDVLSRAGVAPEDALMVGDSPTDMRTALNGGIEALAVGWGYRTAEELRAAFAGEVTGADAGEMPGAALPFRIVPSVPALRIELLGKYLDGKEVRFI